MRDADGNPLARVNVYFAKLKKGAATLGDGHYLIKGVPTGTHVLTAARGTLRTQTDVVILSDSLAQHDIVLGRPK
ncbi:MAG: hypothetical protein GVY29_08510 [Spirochaetes bacterium]|nr:hypothetical protein [Spirochaetota bacterium]